MPLSNSQRVTCRLMLEALTRSPGRPSVFGRASARSVGHRAGDREALLLATGEQSRLQRSSVPKAHAL